MPAALPVEVRAEIVRRREHKESLRSISQELGLAYDTVRGIWRHWQTHGTLVPNYAACRHGGVRKPQAVYEAALALRREHPRWGAVVIRLYLLDEFEAASVPGERTLQTWFRQAGLTRCPPVQHRQARIRRGQAVHEVWAVDAKSRIGLEDHSEVSWLTISDEASGAILDSQAFPLATWEAVEPSQVKHHLQRVFEAWGRPCMIRFDNGLPWGTTTAVPSALGLWLVGLGVQPHFGRPRQSTDNAVVERAHGVLNGWVEPERCPNRELLQGRLTHFARFQRERYPACQKQTRLAAYPQLLDQPRPYVAQEEAACWSLQAVFDYLATLRFQRKVEVNGRFTLLSQTYSLGRAFKRRTLAIQMDPVAHQWVVYDDYGAELRRFAPRHLTYETIASLTLASRRAPG